jgi:hypothetical protein
MRNSISQLISRLNLTEASDTKVPHVFCDQDEVLADFYGVCKRLYNLETNKDANKFLDAPNAWDKVWDTHPNLFALADPMPDAKVLINELTRLQSAKKIRLSVLTALPMPWLKPGFTERRSQAKSDKIQWLSRHFPAAKSIITCARQHKAYYGLAELVATGIKPILIDDNKSNAKEWVSIGNSISILHTSAATSLKELHSHLS